MRCLCTNRGWYREFGCIGGSLGHGHCLIGQVRISQGDVCAISYQILRVFALFKVYGSRFYYFSGDAILEIQSSKLTKLASIFGDYIAIIFSSTQNIED